jgi:hypothetical protein
MRPYWADLAGAACRYMYPEPAEDPGLAVVVGRRLHNRAMYILVGRAGVALVDGENFRAFAVVVEGADVDLGGALEGVGAVDGEYVWLDPEAVRGLAGEAAGPEWLAQFDGMIEFARSKGWVDGAGRVRAHVERR